MHEQDPRPDEDAKEREAHVTTALIALARLLGCLAAREHFAACREKKDEDGEDSEG